MIEAAERMYELYHIQQREQAANSDEPVEEFKPIQVLGPHTEDYKKALKEHIAQLQEEIDETQKIVNQANIEQAEKQKKTEQRSQMIESKITSL